MTNYIRNIYIYIYIYISFRSKVQFAPWYILSPYYMIAILCVHRIVLIIIKHVKIYILVKILLSCLVVSVFVCLYKHLSLYYIHCGSCPYRPRLVWSVQKAAVYWVCVTV